MRSMVSSCSKFALLIARVRMVPEAQGMASILDIWVFSVSFIPLVMSIIAAGPIMSAWPTRKVAIAVISVANASRGTYKTKRYADKRRSSPETATAKDMVHENTIPTHGFIQR